MAKKNKQGVPSIMTDYVGMTGKVDLLGRVSIHKSSKHA